MDIKTLYNRVIGGHLITREEALFLYKEDLGDLTRYAETTFVATSSICVRL